MAENYPERMNIQATSVHLRVSLSSLYKLLRPALMCIFLAGFMILSRQANSAIASSSENNSLTLQLRLPLIRQGWPPRPEVPVISAIDNSDQYNS
jgi:hypothetical protein